MSFFIHEPHLNVKGYSLPHQLLGLTVSAPAQGLIALDNDTANPNARVTATSGGFVLLYTFAGAVK